MAVFLAVQFPLKFKRFKDGEHVKLTYFVAMVTVLTISGVLVAAQVSTGYETVFYIFGCLPGNSDIIYFTRLIVQSLVIGITTSLLAVILWKLVRVSVNRYLISESKVSISVTYKFAETAYHATT